jgi:hypothetical protein
MLLLCKVAEDWSLGRRLTVLSLAFAMALWIKLTTPVLLMASIGAFYLAQGKLKRVVEITLAAFFGCLWFIITFSAYSQLTGFTFAHVAGTFSRLPTMRVIFPPHSCWCHKTLACLPCGSHCPCWLWG